MKLAWRYIETKNGIRNVVCRDVIAQTDHNCGNVAEHVGDLEVLRHILNSHRMSVGDVYNFNRPWFVLPASAA